VTRKIDPQTAFDLIRDQLAIQVASFDRIDAKQGVYFSVGSGLLVVLGGFLAVRAKPLSCLVIALLAISVVCYLALFATEVWGQRVGKWTVGPEIDAIMQDYANGVQEHEIKAKAVRSLESFYNKNRRVYETKRTAAFLGMSGLLLETIFLGAGVVALLIS
jgi:hypothetical protein